MNFPQVEGYTRIQPPGDERITLIVRESHRERFLEAGLEHPETLEERGLVERWLGGGRAPHPVVRVGEDLWVVKRYLRGGLVARWNRDRYLDPGRFFRELEVCRHAVSRGVPTVETIGLVLRRESGGLFRAWAVLPMVGTGATLVETLEVGDRPEARAFVAAGQSVRRMHEAGIDHPDLNLRNVLVDRGAPPAGEPRALLLDWDRARILSDPDPALAHRNLLRLYRSALKGRFESRKLERALRAFLRSYFRGDPAGFRALRAYYRRHRFREIVWHRLFWRS